jgi:hypothetical protein
MASGCHPEQGRRLSANWYAVLRLMHSLRAWLVITSQPPHQFVCCRNEAQSRRSIAACQAPCQEVSELRVDAGAWQRHSGVIEGDHEDVPQGSWSARRCQLVRWLPAARCWLPSRR